MPVVLGLGVAVYLIINSMTSQGVPSTLVS